MESLGLCFDRQKGEFLSMGPDGKWHLISAMEVFYHPLSPFLDDKGQSPSTMFYSNLRNYYIQFSEEELKKQSLPGNLLAELQEKINREEAVDKLKHTNRSNNDFIQSLLPVNKPNDEYLEYYDRFYNDTSCAATLNPHQQTSPLPLQWA